MSRLAIRTCEMELNDFCGSPFWVNKLLICSILILLLGCNVCVTPPVLSYFQDLNLTWYTNSPDLTPCFEKTVLTWIPCGFLWVVLASDIYNSVTSRATNVPWSPLSVAKYIMAALLIVEEAVKLAFSIGRQDQGYIVYPVDTYTPLIKIATYVSNTVR